MAIINSALGDFPVTVKQIVDNEKIVLEIDSTQWLKTEGPGYPVVITMELQPLDDGGTLLGISEAGWKTDEPGLKAAHENCSDWTNMAMCLKSWIEHGTDLS
ncbi:MAG: SRPBCC domain-containing protein [Pirellulaceae bacterium]